MTPIALWKNFFFIYYYSFFSSHSIGQFAFTYSRGNGECKSPVSKIKSCTEDTRMMLNFQACPDVEGTESTGEYANVMNFSIFYDKVNDCPQAMEHKIF